MSIAFKEWAVVIDALARGEQIIILRKGGIHEGPGGFQAEHARFWLFPTQFHQQRESVIPSAQARYDAIAPHFQDSIQVQFSAEVVSAFQITSLARLERLQGLHIWRAEILRERFDWGRAASVWALLVRVAGLERPLELPMSEAYKGCKSWVELEVEIPFASAKPVLSENAFQERVKQVQAALERVAGGIASS